MTYEEILAAFESIDYEMTLNGSLEDIYISDNVNDVENKESGAEE